MQPRPEQTCEAELTRGAFDLAVECFETLLGNREGASGQQGVDKGANVSRARLGLANALLHPDNPDPDWQRAEQLLEQVVAHESTSPAEALTRSQAQVLLSLQKEIERLVVRIRRLRELDLEKVEPPF